MRTYVVSLEVACAAATSGRKRLRSAGSASRRMCKCCGGARPSSSAKPVKRRDCSCDAAGAGAATSTEHLREVVLQVIDVVAHEVVERHGTIARHRPERPLVEVVH